MSAIREKREQNNGLINKLTEPKGEGGSILRIGVCRQLKDLRTDRHDLFRQVINVAIKWGALERK